MLLIDDNAADLELMGQALAEIRIPAKVQTTNGAAQAFALLRGCTHDALPALIVLDLRMPVVDGMQTLRMLKQDAELSAIPVVMFSSSIRPAERAQCLQLGAIAYRVKPSVWPEYIEHARAMARYLEGGCHFAPAGVTG